MLHLSVELLSPDWNCLFTHMYHISKLLECCILFRLDLLSGTSIPDPMGDQLRLADKYDVMINVC